MKNDFKKYLLKNQKKIIIAVIIFSAVVVLVCNFILLSNVRRNPDDFRKMTPAERSATTEELKVNGGIDRSDRGKGAGRPPIGVESL